MNSADLDAVVEANERLCDDRSIAQAAEQLGLSDKLAEGRKQFTFERLMPPDLAEALELLQRPYATDALSASMILLAGFSGLNKIKTRIWADETDSVHPNLYLAVVQGTGGGKTPILKTLVRDPVWPLQQEAFDANRREIQNWEEQCREIKGKEYKPPKPKPLLLQMNNVTDPALVLWLQLHADKGVGTLLIRDELAGHLQSLEADTRNGRGTAESQFLELWDGGSYVETRVGANGGGELRHFADSLVSIYGGIQPQKLKQLIGGDDFTGKWARILFVRVPEKPIELLTRKRSYEEVMALEQARQTLRDYARKIYCLPPKDYFFDEPALKFFADWWKRHQQEAQLPATTQVVKAMLAKSSGQLRRVDGLLHIVRVVAGTAGDRISYEEVELAAAIVDQLFAEMAQFHQGGQTPSMTMMRHIHQISLNAGKAISRQDARDKTTDGCLRDQITAADFKRWAEKLEEMEYGAISLGKRGAVKYEATRPIPV